MDETAEPVSSFFIREIYVIRVQNKYFWSNYSNYNNFFLTTKKRSLSSRQTPTHN